MWRNGSSKRWYGSVCFALDLAGALPCPPIHCISPASLSLRINIVSGDRRSTASGIYSVSTTDRLSIGRTGKGMRTPTTQISRCTIV
ncbi:hypothetical protein EVAR_11150_1 [Eumeta japonica]|uniref:Secreted protein n=1 Tax=Eumeta variegata TaxID=151549 RepID=A0A4C1U497_EUMVA|nr:hypothetical protein EVAR_11150_1 [Eumeta japonica]